MAFKMSHLIQGLLTIVYRVPSVLRSHGPMSFFLSFPRFDWHNFECITFSWSKNFKIFVWNIFLNESTIMLKHPGPKVERPPFEKFSAIAYSLTFGNNYQKASQKLFYLRGSTQNLSIITSLITSILCVIFVSMFKFERVNSIFFALIKYN